MQVSTSGHFSVRPGSAAREVRSFWRYIEGVAPIRITGKEAGDLLVELGNLLLARVQRLHGAEKRLWRAIAANRQRTAKRAMEQIERERQRLGRELHTGVGQLLSAILIQREIIEKQVGHPPAPVQEGLARIGIVVLGTHRQQHARLR